MSIVAIVNPKAGKGRTAQVWAQVQTHLAKSVETLTTSSPGHAIELTADALRRGARTIIAVGGDGTINEVVNGFFDGERAIAPDAALGIIPHGTGSDLRRILHLPADGKEAAEVVARAAARPLDVMRVRYMTHSGAIAYRYSINVTSFGMGGAVAARANRSSKPFGGKVAFLIATLVTTLGFSGSQVQLRLDDSKNLETRITNVAVGNGQFHGSGMWVCPRASLDDGMLDVTIIHHLSLFEILRDLPTLYNGKIYSHPKVEFHRVTHLEANASEAVLIEIDGEPLGRLPLDISICPKALHVLT